MEKEQKTPSLETESDSKPDGKPLNLGYHFFLAFAAWTIVIVCSVLWYVSGVRHDVGELARTQARVAHGRDVLYRRWNAGNGGVYAPVTAGTPPNPYLEVPERDVETPSGVKLTLVNPAYMTRQVHELASEAIGVRGHITSLEPIRPENAADEWETAALQAFERGEAEVSSIELLAGTQYLRLMRPLVTEEGCLRCHATQGYELGDVRGGISVAVPMEPFLAMQRSRYLTLGVGHALFWLLGLISMALGFRNLQRQIDARVRIEAEREKLIGELHEALAELKKLSGLLPICSSCKKIRDDKGYWTLIEEYITDHSEATFSHGICPDCAKRLYPDLDLDSDD